jgi:hypothetical protein
VRRRRDFRVVDAQHLNAVARMSEAISGMAGIACLEVPDVAALMRATRAAVLEPTAAVDETGLKQSRNPIALNFQKSPSDQKSEIKRRRP